MSDTLMKVEQGYSSFTIIFNCDNALVNNEIVKVKLKIDIEDTHNDFTEDSNHLNFQEIQVTNEKYHCNICDKAFSKKKVLM